MYKVALKLLTITACYLFLACDSNSSVTPDYIVDAETPIAMKCEPPEAFLGETVTFSLLIGGRDFLQESEMAIKWLDMDSFSLPYNTPFSFALPENIDVFLENVKENQLVHSYLESFDKKGYIDFPMSASFDLQIPKSNTTRKVTTTKIVRIFKPNQDVVLNQNPLLKAVSATYTLNGKQTETSIKSGDKLTLPFKQTGSLVLFHSTYETSKNDGAERLNFSWFFTKDIDFKSETEINVTGKVDFFLGNETISPYRDYFAVDFSDIFKEIETKSLQLPLVFNFYHVIRDKAVNAESSNDYRYGQDFLWFQVEIVKS